MCRCRSHCVSLQEGLSYKPAATQEYEEASEPVVPIRGGTGRFSHTAVNDNGVAIAKPV